MLVGSIPGVFSTGEQVHLPYMLHVNRQTIHLTDPRSALGEKPGQQMGICSCLHDFRSCPAWRPVLDRVSAAVGYEVCDDPLKFRLAVLVPDRHRTHRKKQPIRDALKYDLTRSTIQSLAVAGLQPLLKPLGPHIQKKAVAHNWLLADTIGQVHGVSHVVNSSKNLAHALLMHYVRPSSVTVLHIFRDMRAMLGAHLKWNPDSDDTQLKKYGQNVQNYHLRIFNACRKTANLPYMPVDYDAYTSDPQAFRQRVSRFLGLAVPDGTVQINTVNYHLVAGNPTRFHGELTIRPATEWKKKLTAEQQAYGESLNQSLPADFQRLLREP